MMKEKVITLWKDEIATPGNRLCPGCTGGVNWRLVTQVLGKSSILVPAATCFSFPAIMYPPSLKIPSLYITMGSASAGASGVGAALRILEKDGKLKEKVNVFSMGGDGGTADIGFASLSGAAERNEDMIYICFDNEAYMNTGIQRSSQTPFGTWTTSTPLGKPGPKKDLPLIMAAHKIPYVATVSASYPEDMVNKITKARDIGKGFRYIHFLTPCPTGWRFPDNKSIELGRLAVETGVWPLFEVENGGKRKLTYKPKPRRPVTDYLGAQGRFRNLKPDEIDFIQKDVDEKWREFGL
ncbi:thiamine pyrophosphate-dependent enzyme [Chloroflexota bacterium]